MVKKIRIGNDISVAWTVNLERPDGSLVDLSTLDLNVQLIVGTKEYSMTNGNSGLTIVGNLISFTYYGSRQEYTGSYVLKLSDAINNSITYDVCNAFIMVSHTWESLDVVTTPTQLEFESSVSLSQVLITEGKSGVTSADATITSSGELGVTVTFEDGNLHFDFTGMASSAALNNPLDAINSAGLGTPTDGQAIVWSATQNKWIYGSAGGGGGDALNQPLSAINSANLGEPDADGQTIAWNNELHKWEYRVGGGSGGGYIGTTAVQQNSTPQELKGITALTASGLATIAGGIKLTTTKKIWFDYDTDAYIEYSIANGFHFSKGLYSDSFVAAGGTGSGGGGVSLNNPLSSINTAFNNLNPAQNGSAILWDSTLNDGDGGWKYGTVASLNTILSHINTYGASLSAPTSNEDGKAIVWDAAQGKWVYGSASGGGDVTWSSLSTWDSTHKIASGYINIGSGLTVNASGEIEATGGSATGLTWSDLAGNDSSKKIHSSHINYGSGLDVDSYGQLYVTGGGGGGGTYYAGTGISINSSNYISVDYGTTSGTACQGNDSRLSDSRPASDVYSWAKAATKPSYDYSEISNTPSVTTYKLNINGSWSGDTTYGTSLGTVYGPASAGTAGYTLVANSSGIPSWSSMIQVSNSGIDVAGTIDATGGISSSSYVAAGGIASSSDEKLKSDIKSITGEKAIDILLSLKPKEWVWNDKNAFLSGNDCAGLIAQDVNNILPFAVRQIGEYLSLNYSVFHAYEIAGLQNHEQRIVELEKKLEYATR